MDRDAFRERSRQAWDAAAPGWQARHESIERQMGLINEWIVARADPQPGQTVLDVATGPGDLGHLAAERVGPSGRVVCSDFSAEMVKVAQGFGAARRLTNVEYRQVDAVQMDLDDDAFDVIVCRFGYMLMSDPGAALAESRRVLRPGGTLAFGVWSTADRNPWAAVPGGTLVARGLLPPPEPGAPGVFSMGDPARIHQLVTAAGFAAPEVEPIDCGFHYSDGDDVWGAIVELNGVMAPVIGALPAEERSALRQSILDAYVPFRNSDGSYDVPAQALGVVTR